MRPFVSLTSKLPPDAEFYFVRPSGATGAFSYNIGSGPVATLTAEKQWCRIKRVGSVAKLIGYGALP